MREKKNIDRLFQEKFKDFEVHPGNHVWEKIASKKEEKEERKIIPLWLRLGGIAAALALLIALGTTLFNNDSTNIENIVNTETPSPNDTKNVVNDKQEASQTTTPSTPSNIDETDTNNSDVANNTNTSFEESSSDPSTANTTSDEKIAPNKNLQNNNSNRFKSAVAQTTSTPANVQNKQNTAQPFSTVLNTSQNTVENAVASETKNNPQKPNDLNNFQEPTNLGTADKTENAVAQNSALENSETTEKSENNQKSLVEEAKAIEAARDEEAIASIEENSNNRRWDIGAVAAPVYYGDFGGSGIDPEFKDNKKSGDVNLSYGVQVSYALNSKFKVRTGVNNVDLSYGTEDIAFSPDIAARELKGVNYTRNAQFLSITDNNTQNNTIAQSDVQGGGNTATPGSISQQVAYVEIPVEAVYVLSDKRFGVELIGGVSTLILNDDKISLESSEGLRTTLGNSNSLNDVSLTTNLGVGLNYKITDNVKVNMEPTFKYQVNAFDKATGDFKPYYLGLYTGVSYRF